LQLMTKGIDSNESHHKIIKQKQIIRETNN
jgi:hypothetical protein